MLSTINQEFAFERIELIRKGFIQIDLEKFCEVVNIPIPKINTYLSRNEETLRLLFVGIGGECKIFLENGYVKILLVKLGSLPTVSLELDISEVVRLYNTSDKRTQRILMDAFRRA